MRDGRQPRRNRRPASRTPRRRASFTARAAVLAVVLAASSIAVAEPLREWLSQRAQIADARSHVDATRKQLAALRSEEQRWSDPSYVADQARQRLHYVPPGTVLYITLSPTPTSTPGTRPTSGGDARPWYGTLWNSVLAAGAATPTPRPSPDPQPSASPALP
ncbi:Septum formation initiator [Acidothermus cellulolyticus 11B]|uniref:Septum formation initiator n=1 Tax=Acidothermus cellulolyticus (strain ATCC 43068 / DSM 8971 / 11B) TaxID=351607 RepID=A0LW70_ACIC1|nr:septum formation initiator family protein [Acidothermus cellulolyticus]ABK53680.1 Septum formation initiator [Acidothermus cellulolyticus 11B]MCL6550865.1 septum formation initiator family protein [Acidothermus cellulolyticus]